MDDVDDNADGGGIDDDDDNGNDDDVDDESQTRIANFEKLIRYGWYWLVGVEIVCLNIRFLVFALIPMLNANILY